MVKYVPMTDKSVYHITFLRHGKSEVEWLNGAVVRYGLKFGVPTPINKQLTGILLSLTLGEIPLTEFRGQPEKLLAKLKSNQ